MKRFIYISLVLVGLAAVSCSKEEMRPVCQDKQEVPVWRSASDAATDLDDEDEGTGSDPITDPNNDKDESTRRRN